MDFRGFCNVDHKSFRMAKPAGSLGKQGYYGNAPLLRAERNRVIALNGKGPIDTFRPDRALCD